MQGICRTPLVQGSAIQVGRRLIDGDHCEDSSACFGYIAAASPHDHLDFLANPHFASGPRAADAVSWRRWSRVTSRGHPSVNPATDDKEPAEAAEAGGKTLPLPDRRALAELGFSIWVYRVHNFTSFLTVFRCILFI